MQLVSNPKVNLSEPLLYMQLVSNPKVNLSEPLSPVCPLAKTGHRQV